VTNVECRKPVPFLLFTLSIYSVVVVLLLNLMFRHMLIRIKMSWLCRGLCPFNKINRVNKFVAKAIFIQLVGRPRLVFLSLSVITRRHEALGNVSQDWLRKCYTNNLSIVTMDPSPKTIELRANKIQCN